MAGHGVGMRDWSDRFRDGGGNDTVHRTAFNVQLSFRLEPEDTKNRRRRVLLVGEALKAIAHRDERMRSWEFLSDPADEWVVIAAIVVARQPGEVAELSEEWMRSAIAAANLAAEPALIRVPSQRTRWAALSTPQITAQVLAGS